MTADDQVMRTKLEMKTSIIIYQIKLHEFRYLTVREESL